MESNAKLPCNRTRVYDKHVLFTVRAGRLQDAW
jgi:hypothetical protein